MSIHVPNRCVYVAGPYTPRDDEITPLLETMQIEDARRHVLERHLCDALDVGAAARAAGAAAIVPHTSSMMHEDRLTEDEWLGHGVALLHRCDAVLVLPGYGLSRGCRYEVAAAEAFHLPVYSVGKISWDPVVAFSATLRRWLAGES